MCMCSAWANLRGVDGSSSSHGHMHAMHSVTVALAGPWPVHGRGATRVLVRTYAYGRIKISRNPRVLTTRPKAELQDMCVGARRRPDDRPCPQKTNCQKDGGLAEAHMPPILGWLLVFIVIFNLAKLPWMAMALSEKRTWPGPYTSSPMFKGCTGYGQLQWASAWWLIIHTLTTSLAEGVFIAVEFNFLSIADASLFVAIASSVAMLLILPFYDHIGSLSDTLSVIGNIGCVSLVVVFVWINYLGCRQLKGGRAYLGCRQLKGGRALLHYSSLAVLNIAPAIDLFGIIKDLPKSTCGLVILGLLLTALVGVAVRIVCARMQMSSNQTKDSSRTSLLINQDQ